MESGHRAMIVISHPWEFTPKGNSHFNYLSLSNASGLDQTRNQNNNNTTNVAAEPQSEHKKKPNVDQQKQQQHPQANFYLPKSHTSRVLMPHQSKMNPVEDMNNTTMSDLSFSYYGKSPFVGNNANFDNNVTV